MPAEEAAGLEENVARESELHEMGVVVLPRQIVVVAQD